MLLADARLAASIMMSCSITASLTGVACVWTMNTCAPRIDSSKRQWISPSANSRRLASVSVTPSLSAMSMRQRRMATPRHDHEASFGECLHGASVQGYERGELLGSVGEGRHDLARGDHGTRREDDEGRDAGLGADARVRSPRPSRRGRTRPRRRRSRCAFGPMRAPRSMTQ